MDDHYKREGLEIFYLHQKSVFILFFFFKPVTNSSNICYLNKTITSWHDTWLMEKLIIQISIQFYSLSLSSSFFLLEFTPYVIFFLFRFSVLMDTDNT